jgi:dihydroorotate dehydrogenase (fumarate)
MLSTTVAGITLNSCVYNASGPRSGSLEALIKIGESDSGAILSKSATLLKQDGNPLPRFLNKIDLGSEFCQGSMNSEGLPNLGIDYCEYYFMNNEFGTLFELFTLLFGG